VATDDTDFNVRLVQEPAGVAGLVTPWNFPLMQAAAKVAPALAAGCSMVLKPSSVCPATCLRLGDLALEAGLPAGALNIVTGTGREAGSALLDHRFVDRLSFTGSSGVGHTVHHAAANRLVPVSLELGGKGAIVVFDDVDLEATVDWIMVGIFLCAGQSCSATSRLVVQRGVEAKLLERLVEVAGNLRTGDPLDEATQLGPLTTKEQLDIVSGFVDRARQEGAEVICGGSPIPGKGYYYPPTILRAASDSEAWREEIFGPVLCVQSFDTEEEAVRIANDSEYGLGNAVVTEDAERCERVAQQLHAGVVWKNCSNAIPTEAPFGGFGKSGFGKEYGAMGFEEYVQTKVITGCKPGFSFQWYTGK
jgi:betaine-aldehyde dehydrogenase